MRRRAEIDRPSPRRRPAAQVAPACGHLRTGTASPTPVSRTSSKYPAAPRLPPPALTAAELCGRIVQSAPSNIIQIEH